MNLGGIAVSAFGGAVSDLTKSKVNDVRAVFRQDSFVRLVFITEM